MKKLKQIWLFIEMFIMFIKTWIERLEIPMPSIIGKGLGEARGLSANIARKEARNWKMTFRKPAKFWEIHIINKNGMGVRIKPQIIKGILILIAILLALSLTCCTISKMQFSKESFSTEDESSKESYSTEYESSKESFSTEYESSKESFSTEDESSEESFSTEEISEEPELETSSEKESSSSKKSSSEKSSSEQETSSTEETSDDQESSSEQETSEDQESSSEQESSDDQ